MFKRQIHIVLFVLGVLLPTLSLAQISIKGNFSVKGNTTLTVMNSDIILDSDSINIEGDLVLNTDGSHQVINLSEKEVKVVVNNANIDKPRIEDNQKLNHKIAKEVKKEKLPVRYINIEADSYVSRNENKPQREEVKEGSGDATGGILVHDTVRWNPLTEFYYNLPIYSYTLNERISDYAELYEFEFPTAILKPPMV